MSSVRKFIIYGPADTIQRLNDNLTESIRPVYRYSYQSPEQDESVMVFMYEEVIKLQNISRSATLILEYSAVSAKIDLISTGGQIGFSGTGSSDEINITERITEFILDFTKRFGLTIQEVLPVVVNETGV